MSAAPRTAPGPGGATPGEPLAKGSTLLSTERFVQHAYGEAALAAVLARIPPADRERITASRSIEEIPYDLLLTLWRACDEVLAADHPDWIERSGAFAIESVGVEMYGGILRKRSPREFLTQRISLFRLYYQPGDMEVVAEERDRAVLRLVDFPPRSRLFCRRQTGGLLRSVEVAGASSASVAHTRCSLDGDAFCEWELAWR